MHLAPSHGVFRLSRLRSRGAALILALTLVWAFLPSPAQATTTAALVRDIWSGPNGSHPNNQGSGVPLAVVNGIVYFSAHDGTSGNELWKSDGTTAGTTMVKDIRSGSSGSNPTALTEMNGTLYFRANDGTNGFELWRSDGTATGTTMVKDITPGSVFLPVFSNSLTDVSGTLYFNANDGTSGDELWRSDGTAAGTTMVKDINPGAASSSSWQLTDVNGTLYFRATDGTNGVELWKSDGTAAGTTMVKDINPGTSNSNPHDLTVVNGTLYFQALVPGFVSELWKSDGTAAGTNEVKDGIFSPKSLTDVDGTLFFLASPGPGSIQELWRSDGTVAGTTLVANIDVDFFPNPMTAVNGALYFRGGDGTNGFELWRSDGTTAGTAMLKDINPGGASSTPIELTEANGTLYFDADDGTHGRELWQSDGTTGGTTMVNDISPGIAGSTPSSLTEASPTLYFSSDDGTHGRELWRTTAGDTTGPTTTAALDPVDPGGENGWYVSPVGVTISAADEAGGSGIADTRCILGPSSPPTTFADLPPGCAYMGAGASVTADGEHTLYAASKDADGNEETPVSVGFKIDMTAPTVTCDPAPTFLLNQSGASVSATVADTTSDAAQSPVGASASTAAVGAQSAPVTGADKASNETTEHCDYMVTYDFAGFSAPVDNLDGDGNPILNVVKVARGIPLRWRVTDANGAPVTTITSTQITAINLNCGLAVSADQVEEVVAGGSGLQNLGDGNYQLNWKPPTSYANSCKRLRLNLFEGSTTIPVFHTADFRFKK
jgi:ELWxxDGT repeat protein